MAGFCVWSPTRQCFGISVFLLLVFIQMPTSLWISGGVFIFSDSCVIAPFKLADIPQYGYSYEIKTIFLLVSALGLQTPVVLVSFAMLCMLFAAYSKDRATLGLRIACQEASVLLLLIGTCVFSLYYRPCMSWENLTMWFYTTVPVQLELVVTTVLSCLLRRKLTSDWK